MKTLLKIGICLLLAVGFAACDKDETPVTGRLKVSCQSSDGLTFFLIYTETNENIIYSKQNPNADFSEDLNPGNYSFTFTRSSGGSSGRDYFQIRAGRTTKISYNKGVPTVDYE